MKRAGLALTLALAPFTISPLTARAQERAVVVAPPVVVPGSTVIRIRPLRDATVRVYDGDRMVGELDHPGSITVPSGRSYRVDAERDGAVVWSGNVDGRGGSVDVVWGPEGAPTPSPRPAPAPLAAMDGSAFANLVAAMHDTFFEDDKLALLRASSHNHFSSAQADALLGAFDFERDRMRAFRILRPRIVDPENGYILAHRFFFSRDKRRVLAAFGH